MIKKDASLYGRKRLLLQSPSPKQLAPKRSLHVNTLADPAVPSQVLDFKRDLLSMEEKACLNKPFFVFELGDAAQALVSNNCPGLMGFQYNSSRSLVRGQGLWSLRS